MAKRPFSDVDDAAPPAAVPTSFSGRRHPCLKFGECRFQDHCEYKDVPFEVCRYNLKQSCRLGATCPGAHVPWERLVAREPVAPPMLASYFSGVEAALASFPEFQTTHCANPELTQAPVPLHLQEIATRLSGRLHPCMNFGHCNFLSACDFKNFPREVCRYFLKQQCRAGETCPGVHVTLGELQVLQAANLLPSSQSLPDHLPDAPPKHEHAPKKPREDVLPQRLQELSRKLSGKTHPCLKYGERCHFGDRCEYINAPIELCRYNLRGSCRWGEECSFLHVSNYELLLLISRAQNDQSTPPPVTEL
eukprot:TRINITY_DN12990_c0_g1_i1.p1 TRINITY_DN12990_c0_g1~~TRINITY_DN12990_c0_g1_i1.p1  ORF type:complete len:315 (-),score=20.92 TRINITY_DN12990_c0_g1_i1:10-927(-)